MVLYKSDLPPPPHITSAWMADIHVVVVVILLLLLCYMKVCNQGCFRGTSHHITSQHQQQQKLCWARGKSVILVISNRQKGIHCVLGRFESCFHL